MNKYLRRFLVMVVGCSLVLGGASFASEKNSVTSETLPSATESADWDDEDWDDEDWGDEDWDDEDFEVGEFPETGEAFVKELEEYFTLSKSDSADVEKLFNEVITLEEDFEKSNDESDKAFEEAFEKIDEKWASIDAILEPYEKEALIKEDLPEFSTFLSDMCIEQTELDSNVESEIKELYTKLEEEKKANDVDGFYNTYEKLFEVIDEKIGFDDYSDDEYEDMDFDAYEDLSEEEMNELFFKEIAEFTVEDFLEEIPVEMDQKDVNDLKALHVEMKAAAEKKDAELVDSLFEKFDKILEKYDDAIEKYYDEEFDNEENE